MSLKDYTKEQLAEISMLDIAYELLVEQNSPADYQALLSRIAELRDMTETQIQERISHLYTQMSIDGRFVNLGENRWGLRSWYPFDQTEEELSQTMPKKKKARAEEDEEVVDEFEVEDIDEFEDLEDELDDLANEEDTDFDELDEDEEEEYDEEDEDEDDDEEDFEEDEL
ncbi:DNA-directed RNA polymerase subunit delta [Paenalkalicoccus suaedae]|uniref:Probable DNA-directed RNA polymerase subunit delta n=1 Tax=Paenalkalicoccus suaedae TaxID=2592382 RepID=A0A859FI94_9BACI|nr:DNA-directed RNA polymerase subunit delta [Paenalkalicoccus suaedae]QKS72789.1 DNA-directed RNA polymerase subunit delta [Paenalkalicoccus suaedae]